MGFPITASTHLPPTESEAIGTRVRRYRFPFFGDESFRYEAVWVLVHVRIVGECAACVRQSRVGVVDIRYVLDVWHDNRAIWYMISSMLIILE